MQIQSAAVGTVEQKGGGHSHADVRERGTDSSCGHLHFWTQGYQSLSRTSCFLWGLQWCTGIKRVQSRHNAGSKWHCWAADLTCASQRGTSQGLSKCWRSSVLPAAHHPASSQVFQPGWISFRVQKTLMWVFFCMRELMGLSYFWNFWIHDEKLKTSISCKTKSSPFTFSHWRLTKFCKMELSI